MQDVDVAYRNSHMQMVIVKPITHTKIMCAWKSAGNHLEFFNKKENKLETELMLEKIRLIAIPKSGPIPKEESQWPQGVRLAIPPFASTCA